MKQCILYIEDNPLNMGLVRKIVMSLGYDMLSAEEGLVGIQLAEQHRPDLIIIDINLPDIDGLEVTARIRQHPEISKTPIVALTANAMHGDRERCLAAGCDAYIAKPISRLEVRNVLRHFLNQAT